MNERILFLDVDGVLNPDINIQIKKQSGQSTSSYYITIPADKIIRLKRIVDMTHCKIIMSSSWRIKDSMKSDIPSRAYINLDSQLKRFGICMSGWTPLTKDRVRGLEIQYWLDTFYQRNGYYPCYIIIDDEIGDILPFHKGHCIKTTRTFGLQDNHVYIAANLMKKLVEEENKNGTVSI